MRIAAQWALVPLTLFSLALTDEASAQVPPGWTQYTRAVDAYTDNNGIVGSSALLIQNGRVVARHHRGFANKSAGAPVNERTIFHYGSITKVLTAIAIMQLRDRGLLSLDDRVVRWVPELRKVHDPYNAIDSITVRMLLSHSAGFQFSTWPYSQGLDWQPFEPTTWEQLVAMMPYEQLLFKPGTRANYSNPAFIYAARIIELVTGDPWDVYVQKNIFAPLGMTRSYFRSTPYYLAADRSHNYYILRDSTTKRDTLVDNGTDFNPGITIPNGGWNAPLDDVAAFMLFLVDAAPDAPTRERYRFVLSRQSLEEMWRPVFPLQIRTTVRGKVGLTFYVDDSSEPPLVGHDGSQAGFVAYMYVNPANRSGLLTAVNTTNFVSSTRMGPVIDQGRALLR